MPFDDDASISLIAAINREMRRSSPNATRLRFGLSMKQWNDLGLPEKNKPSRMILTDLMPAIRSSPRIDPVIALGYFMASAGFNFEGTQDRDLIDRHVWIRDAACWLLLKLYPDHNRGDLLRLLGHGDSAQAIAARCRFTPTNFSKTLRSDAGPKMAAAINSTLVSLHKRATEGER